MDREDMRLSLNAFLKMYFDSCREIYKELDNIELLTGKQFEHLRLIDKHGEITMGKLAELTGLSKPTVTEMIKRFEETALIEKRRCQADGRVFFIRLTDHGKTLANTNKLESERAVDKIFARLDDDDIAQLKRLFDKFKEASR